MCNLSQGIEEQGIAIGEAKKEIKVIFNMYQKGFSIDQIAMVTDKSIKEIETILEKKEPVLQ